MWEKIFGGARKGLPAYILAAALALTAQAADQTVTQAERLLTRTDYEGAIRIASQVENSAQAEYVKGRAYFMLGDFKKATTSFERAVTLSPNESNYHLWLGRTYGRRAETANWLSATGLASKTRESFEKAIELDPKNLEALDDLFAYSLEAPGFLGGGLDKARKIAEKIRTINSAEYHFAMAQIAMKGKEYNVAEQNLRMAAQLAPKQVGRLLDLGKFLAKRGRLPEAEAAFAQAEQVAPNSAKVKFSRAEAYIQSGKNLDRAKVLLEEYLRTPNLTADDPPRYEAQRLLKKASGG